MNDLSPDDIVKIERGLSQAERLQMLAPEDREKLLSRMSDKELESLQWDWEFWGRPKQLPPPGSWQTWVLRAGRGFGKTRTGVHWVHKRAMSYPKRWTALVARTPSDARDYMIEGPGGFMRNIRPDECPKWEPSKKRLTWPNGSWATVYSDDEPDQLRGFSGDTAWLDEFAKFKNPKDCWDNLAFGMREASTDMPRRLITTTPRPLDVLMDIMKMEGTEVVIGSSYENKANLDPGWFKDTISVYEGTRTGRQEIHAELLTDIPGALWTHDMLERCRVKPQDLEKWKKNGFFFKRIVVAVDPSGTAGSNSDRHMRETADDVGIMIGGLGSDGKAYLLADWTCNLPPAGWGRRVNEAYNHFGADRIVAERNFGGAMVEHVIASVNRKLPVKLVTASRGKVARAEPVASYYEQGLVHHVGVFPELEDQLTSFAPNGYIGSSKSPDRADAAIWLLTELLVQVRQGSVGVVKIQGGNY